MKGLSFQEFYNSLYYGADIDFSYNSSFFHVNAGSDEKGHGILVYVYDKHPDEKPTHCDEIYDKTMLTASESVESFLQAQIFEGKSVYDIHNDIEILYS